MGKCDKFEKKYTPLPSNQSKIGAEAEYLFTKAHTIIQNAKRDAKVSGFQKLIYGKTNRIVTALDVTASMSSQISTAKKSISEIIKRVGAEATSPIEIELVIYCYYDVSDKLIERSGFKSDTTTLHNWLSKVLVPDDRGNSVEALEVAIQAACENHNISAVLITGDEPFNSRENMREADRNGATAEKLAITLGQRKVPIRSFIDGNDSRTVSDFMRLTDFSNGKSVRLDGSSEMINQAVMAILATNKGRGSVREYMEHNNLSKNIEKYGQLLIGKSQ